MLDTLNMASTAALWPLHMWRIQMRTWVICLTSGWVVSRSYIRHDACLMIFSHEENILMWDMTHTKWIWYQIWSNISLTHSCVTVTHYSFKWYVGHDSCMRETWRMQDECGAWQIETPQPFISGTCLIYKWDIIRPIHTSDIYSCICGARQIDMKTRLLQDQFWKAPHWRIYNGILLLHMRGMAQRRNVVYWNPNGRSSMISCAIKSFKRQSQGMSLFMVCVFVF